MNRYLTLVKREYWENRGGYLWAPLVTGGVFVVLMIMGILITEALTGRARIQIGMLRLGDALKAMDERARLIFGMGVDGLIVQITVLIGIVIGIVVFFYCLNALYDERRDRSILFWKSLPVSDSETVLAKAVSATVVAPLIGLAAAIVTSLLTLMVLTTWLAIRGTGLAGMVWTESHLFRVYATMLASLPVALVFALPTVGWLLLCSAWARSKPFLWAVALPVGTGVLVVFFGLMQSFSLPSAWFWKNVVLRALGGTLPGNWMRWDDIERFARTNGPEEALQLIHPGLPFGALADPAPWIAAAIGVAMIVIAIRLRRHRELAD